MHQEMEGHRVMDPRRAASPGSILTPAQAPETLSHHSLENSCVQAPVTLSVRMRKALLHNKQPQIHKGLLLRLQVQLG